MKALHPSPRPADPARRGVRWRIRSDEGGALGLVAGRRPLMSCCEVRVLLQPALGRLDATQRLDPADPEHGKRAREPVPGGERRPVVEVRGHSDHHRKVEMTSGGDIDGRAGLPSQLNRYGIAVINRLSSISVHPR